MVVRKPRFQIGDIIEVAKYWDQCDDAYISGIIQITGYEQYETIIYQTKCLKGNTNWIAYNSTHFDILPYLVWLGNINDTPMLKVLYGTK